MNRNLLSASAMGAVATMALIAAAVITSTAALADEDPLFVSTRTREEVRAELKVPYPGGNPWSGSYNMFQARSAATSEQIQSEYIANRDRANAFQGEDSGSVYILKAQSLAPSSATVMGAPAR
jgi:hypothetical protein